MATKIDQLMRSFRIYSTLYLLCFITSPIYGQVIETKMRPKATTNVNSKTLRDEYNHTDQLGMAG